MTNNKYGVGCWGLIVNKSNQVLLLKRKGRKIWERPGGKLEIGETLEECLNREILEETNIKLNKLEPLITQQIYSPENDSHWICICYICNAENAVPKLMEPNKHTDVKWFDINNIPEVTNYTQEAITLYLSKSKEVLENNLIN